MPRCTCSSHVRDGHARLVTHEAEDAEDDKPGEDARAAVDHGDQQRVPAAKNNICVGNMANSSKTMHYRIPTFSLTKQIITCTRCCGICCNWTWLQDSRTQPRENRKSELLLIPKPARKKTLVSCVFAQTSLGYQKYTERSVHFGNEAPTNRQACMSHSVSRACKNKEICNTEMSLKTGFCF